MKTAAAVLGILVLACVGAVLWLRIHGFSARDEPSALEKVIAGNLRWLATPPSVRDLKSPVAPSADVLLEGREHFADHCAVCHGKDGSGDTTIGRGLYPKPPDLRKEATQSLADGELFTIIQEGIRFTGMPGFGGDDPAEAQEHWEIVHFIRHLPKMTPEELREMEKGGSKGPAEEHEHPEQHQSLEGGD